MHLYCPMCRSSLTLERSEDYARSTTTLRVYCPRCRIHVDKRISNETLGSVYIDATVFIERQMEDILSAFMAEATRKAAQAAAQSWAPAADPTFEPSDDSYPPDNDKPTQPALTVPQAPRHHTHIHTGVPLHTITSNNTAGVAQHTITSNKTAGAEQTLTLDEYMRQARSWTKP